MSEFMKNDSEKNRLELLDYAFIEGMGRILTFGAKKYDAWNWQKAGSDEDLERLKGAMQRHSMAYMKGQKLDPETGESHLYHMGCCMMFLDYFDRSIGKEPHTLLGVKQPVVKSEEEAVGLGFLFPVELTAIENTITQGLRDNGYRDWILLGFDEHDFAGIQNDKTGYIHLVRSFNDFDNWVKNES